MHYKLICLTMGLNASAYLCTYLHLISTVPLTAHSTHDYCIMSTIPQRSENYYSLPLYSSVREDYSVPQFLYPFLTLSYNPLHICHPPLHHPYTTVRKGYGLDHHSNIVLLTRVTGTNLQESRLLSKL